MKKIIAAVLAALMVLGTVGCAQAPESAPTTTAAPTTEPTPTEPPTTEPPTTEPPTTEPTTTVPPTMANDWFDPEQSAQVIGTWKTEIILDGTLISMPEMEGSVSFSLFYILRDDGTYSRGMEAENFTTAISQYHTMVEQFMMDSYHAKFTAEKKINGWGSKKIEKEWEANGKIQAESNTASFIAGLRLSDRFSTLTRNGDYYEQEGKLCFSKGDGTYESCTFLMENSILTLVDTDDPTAYRQFPITFPCNFETVA